MITVAVGVPGWPRPATSWDWWSIVGVLLVCLVATRSLGLHLRWPTAIAAIILGPLLSAIVHRWGVVEGLGWPLLVLIGLSLARRGWTTGRPPTV
jgi:hypothetical protein